MDAPSPLHRFVAFFCRPTIGHPSKALILPRLAVGGVFLASGLIKLVFPNQGPGRFAKLGLPFPGELAYFVGGIEVLCGCLLIVGLMVRLAAIPLVVDMVVAIATTKMPLLVGPGPEPVAALPKMGLWAFAYQARLDLTMLLACLFLVAIGSGLLSVDALLARRRWEGRLLAERGVPTPS
jgi:putative oxidoreductase